MRKSILQDGETHPIFGYLNGNGDKDGFKIHYPGTYIFRTTIAGGVDADAVTGMALRLKNTGSGANWFDVPCGSTNAALTASRSSSQESSGWS